MSRCKSLPGFMFMFVLLFNHNERNLHRYSVVLFIPSVYIFMIIWGFQAHMDIASLLIKNVYKPLEEVATYKSSQSQKLYTFRENFDDLLRLSEQKLYVVSVVLC